MPVFKSKAARFLVSAGCGIMAPTYLAESDWFSLGVVMLVVGLIIGIFGMFGKIGGGSSGGGSGGGGKDDKDDDDEPDNPDEPDDDDEDEEPKNEADKILKKIEELIKKQSEILEKIIAHVRYMIHKYEEYLRRAYEDPVNPITAEDWQKLKDLNDEFNKISEDINKLFEELRKLPLTKKQIKKKIKLTKIYTDNLTKKAEIIKELYDKFGIPEDE